MLRTRRPLLALVVLAVLLAGGYLLSAVRSDPGGGGPAGRTVGQTATGTAAAPVGPTAAGTPAAPGRSAPSGAAPSAGDGLRVVPASALPAEARRTLDLIDRGGPFPYPRDGVVFGNNERLLPRHPRGWYREYTVPTPGEGDRGARRIVTGDDGARYYTADHYESFVRVDPVR